jgi:hypothetical protein
VGHLNVCPFKYIPQYHVVKNYDSPSTRLSTDSGDALEIVWVAGFLLLAAVDKMQVT